jgi:hypothetical protein
MGAPPGTASLRFVSLLALLFVSLCFVQLIAPFGDWRLISDDLLPELFQHQASGLLTRGRLMGRVAQALPADDYFTPGHGSCPRG